MLRGPTVKRRQPLKRVKGLETRIDQVQAWRRRTQQTALDRGSSKTRRVTKRANQRRNQDEEWRAAVFALRGRWCRSCGSVRDVQVDHLVGRVGAARLAVEAGLPLCGDFGVGRCHPRKTRYELKVQRSWLDADQVQWLEDQGFVRWLPDGTVAGTRSKAFAPVDLTQEEGTG